MKKIFGSNIAPDCAYCHHSAPIEDGFICIKKKQLINGKCKSFSYNPLMRVPKTQPKMQKYTIDDFVV